MSSNVLLNFVRNLNHIFNLRLDADEEGTVENIRKNVDFHGANAWTLVFAIFIASIGLNMNSAAVVIGAMLISPLMGPILGVGLALGINDEVLLRKSARNLSVTMLISVFTSMIYFLLSPLHEAQSELLARTYPTFYDVLIAFSGGAAGIVSISRRERGPSVAGVAIATALMPPLCTAGYALANGNLKFLAGALYLFLINSVFIALSTFLFVRYMKFKVVQFQEKDDKLKLRRWLGLIVTAMVIPSLFFAWSLLQESRFKLRAERFLREEFHSKSTFIVNQQVRFSYSKPKIEINLVGKPLKEEELLDLKSKMPLYGLEETELEVRQLDPNEPVPLPQKSALDVELARLREFQAEKQRESELFKQLTDEAEVLFPGIVSVIQLGEQVGVVWQKPPGAAQVQKFNKFLSVRRSREEKPVHVELVK